jgi:hypothetical protein
MYTIFEFIKDWEDYRRAVEVSKELPSATKTNRTKSFKKESMEGKSPDYRAGYEAGVRQSNIDDDPKPDITPSQVTCKGGEPGSDWCRGYQQGYSDNDRAMYGN